MIADAVSEVLTLQAGDIEDTPDFGSGAGKVKILLDINRVFAGAGSGLPRIVVSSLVKDFVVCPRLTACFPKGGAEDESCC